MATTSLDSLFHRFAFRLRHNELPARVRTVWFRFCGAKIGPGTLMPETLITWPHQVQIGSGCVLEPDIFFKFDGTWHPGPSIIVGNTVFIGRGCEFNIKQSIRIGNHCLIGSGAKFIDHDHNIQLGDLISRLEGPAAPIVLGNDVWIGDNAILLKGVTVGDGSVIAAGAVVTRKVGSFEIWAGVPARKIGVRKYADAPHPNKAAEFLEQRLSLA